jgi:hypothetical protein
MGQGRMALFGILAGCNGAITLELTTDRPIPQGLDAVCVGVADALPRGGHFGRFYRLEGKLATMPQTLRIEPGAADFAYAWVRGDRGGVPAALGLSRIDFRDGVTIALDRCVLGRGDAPHEVGPAVGPANARLVASEGQVGTLVVAVAPGATALVDMDHGRLVTYAAPDLPPGNPVALVAADLDGDCDDDVIVATDGAPPEVWLRESDHFVDAGPLGTTAVAALATGDINADGFTDVIAGGGGTLAPWVNEGTGKFMPGSLDAAGRVSAISALALGDVDGDGNPDLIVGQAGAPLEGWLGAGGGAFTAADALVPPVTLDVERLALVDADGDLDPDLVVAVRNAPMKLYVDRDGLLEDQTFVRVPQPAPVVHAIAIGGWDDQCGPDAVLASDAGAPTWRGQPDGSFAAETAMAPIATDVVMVDIDDDGNLDAVLATAQGVQWLAR